MCGVCVVCVVCVVCMCVWCVCGVCGVCGVWCVCVFVLCAYGYAAINLRVVCTCVSRPHSLPPPPFPLSQSPASSCMEWLCSTTVSTGMTDKMAVSTGRTLTALSQQPPLELRRWCSYFTWPLMCWKSDW